MFRRQVLHECLVRLVVDQHMAVDLHGRESVRICNASGQTRILPLGSPTQ
jgi:hypothetical protein